MAAKKAEIEADRDTYHAILEDVKRAVHEKNYHEAITLAKSAWPCIAGMMQYGRRYEQKEFDSIEAIDVVLKWAPRLLDMESLNEVRALLAEDKRLERRTSVDLGDKLAAAETLLWDAHRAWSFLEAHPDCSQQALHSVADSNPTQCRRLVETWEKIGLIKRLPDGTSYRLVPTTRMDEVVSAKCPACGRIQQEAKSTLLEEGPCPACGTTAFHVILPSD